MRPTAKAIRGLVDLGALINRAFGKASETEACVGTWNDGSLSSLHRAYLIQSYGIYLCKNLSNLLLFALPTLA